MRPVQLAALMVLPGWLVTGGRMWGQASPTATGPGGFVAVGATVSGYHNPYGEQRVGGFSVFADANLTHNVGIEAEYRDLSFRAQEGTQLRNYLAGPRYALRYGRWMPYAKFLVGRGEFRFPYGDANGSYFALAPGAGVDLRVLHGRASVRLIDFEYQDWRGFTFGPDHPYGVSAGVSVRVF